MTVIDDTAPRGAAPSATDPEAAEPRTEPSPFGGSVGTMFACSSSSRCPRSCSTTSAHVRSPKRRSRFRSRSCLRLPCGSAPTCSSTRRTGTGPGSTRSSASSVGFVGFFVAEANGLLRSLFDSRVRIAGQGVFDDISGWRTQPLDINGLLWGAHRRRRARPRHVPAQRTAPATGPSAARRGGVRRVRIPHGVRLRRLGLAADRLDEAVGLRGCRCGGVRVGRSRAIRAPRGRAVRRSPGAGAGWVIGAWGGGDIGRGNFLGAVYATVVPAAILGVRFGLAALPTATEAPAHRTAVSRLDLRGAGDGVHRVRTAGAADPDDLPLVPQPQRQGVGRVGQLQPDLHQQEFGQLRQLGEHLHESALLPRAGAVRPRDPHRGDRGTAYEAALRGWPELVRSDPGRLLRALVRHPRVDSRHDLQQRLVGHRRDVAGLGVRARRRGAGRPCARRECRQVTGVPPDGDLVHRRRHHLALHVPGPRRLAGPDRGVERHLGGHRRDHHVDDGEGRLARRAAPARGRCSRT